MISKPYICCYCSNEVTNHWEHWEKCENNAPSSNIESHNITGLSTHEIKTPTTFSSNKTTNVKTTIPKHARIRNTQTKLF